MKFFYKLTIRNKIIISFTVIIVMLVSVNALTLKSMSGYLEKYNSIVKNITKANSMNLVFKEKLDTEMWLIVIGRVKFEEGKQYDMINEAEHKIRQLMQSTSPENKYKLDILLRTFKTLRVHVDKLGNQIKNRALVAENEAVLEDIRSVTSLINDNIQDYIYHEVNIGEKIRAELESDVKNMIIVNVIFIFITLCLAVFAVLVISDSITKPIRELSQTAAIVSQGNLDVRVKNVPQDEITILSNSFNTMIEQIKVLMENVKIEQENLKKAELKLLQAQINPHFLYNTLDTIVWMAQSNDTQQVIVLVKALSNFFRLTLSGGQDFITLKDEIDHVISYLTIQKIRYKDILDFEINMPEDFYNFKILKLTLQPIVENAIYHGIKNRRGKGKIEITAEFCEDDALALCVKDNGIGMTKEKLDEVNDYLKQSQNKGQSYGLYNVNQRIKLHFGETFGVNIKSSYNVGTCVCVKIPALIN